MDTVLCSSSRSFRCRYGHRRVASLSWRLQRRRSRTVGRARGGARGSRRNARRWRRWMEAGLPANGSGTLSLRRRNMRSRSRDRSPISSRACAAVRDAARRGRVLRHGGARASRRAAAFRFRRGCACSWCSAARLLFLHTSDPSDSAATVAPAQSHASRSSSSRWVTPATANVAHHQRHRPQPVERREARGADGRRLAARSQRRADLHQGRSARLPRARAGRRSAVQSQRARSGINREISSQFPRRHRRGSSRRSRVDTKLQARSIGA